MFKFQCRNIKLDWIYGSEVKPWIRSNNLGSLARTLDLRNKNVMLDPIEKNCGVGENAMPDNEIHVTWIKPLDPKYKCLFYCTFFTLLRIIFQNNSDPYTEVTPD